MTDKRNHQGEEAYTPGLASATQPGDPGAAPPTLANTGDGAAPGIDTRRCPEAWRYIYGHDA